MKAIREFTSEPRSTEGAQFIVIRTTGEESVCIYASNQRHAAIAVARKDARDHIGAGDITVTVYDTKEEA